MAVDLVRDREYLILAYIEDQWYERVPVHMRNASIYDFAREVGKTHAVTGLTFEELDPRTQSFELLVAHYCRTFPKFNVCDVGSHYGVFMMDAVRVVEANSGEADLFAFDAGIAADLTWRNFENNGFTTIKFTHAAVGPMNGHVPMFIDAGNSEDNRLVNGSGASVPVRCIRLDTYLEQQNAIRPSCVKIDVQGAEPAVMAGMTSLLASQPVTMQIEMAPWAMRKSGMDPIAFLDELLVNYTIFEIGALRQHLRHVHDGLGGISTIDGEWPYWTDLLLIPRSLQGVEQLIAPHVTG